MLEMLLTIAAVIVVISCMRIFINEHEYTQKRRGHIFFIYGARGGFTDIIADMLYRSATNEISNPDFRRWKVIHQSDYYKPYSTIIQNKSCCKTVKYTFYKDATERENYYEYVSYDNENALDVELMMADVKYYIRRGINVILEGNISLNTHNNPAVFVEYDVNNLLEICKDRSRIIPTNEKHINIIRRKIIENYTPYKWTTGWTTNSVVINATDLTDTYESVAGYFKKIQLQIDANSDDDRAYTCPVIN